MSRTYVPGAPRTARDHAAAGSRALRRRADGLHAAVARVVAGLTSRQLERFPIGPIVVGSLPLVLRARFRRDYAVDFDGREIDALIVLVVLRDGGRRSDRFEVVIERRRSRIRRRPAGDRHPDATLTLALADLIRMTTAAVDPHALAGEGRLKITGDTFLAIRFPGMFRQPARSAI